MKNESSFQISIRFPKGIFEALKKFIPNTSRRDFIRKAVSEKLSRDFGANIPPELSRCGQGKRTDLDTPEKRAAKLPALREQARKARESKQGGKE
ncbi:MAG: hypothetical protein IKM45_06755 [Opitutales bacterium]|nr:hypothetical protein [Opitutales bacterium]